MKEKDYFLTDTFVSRHARYDTEQVNEGLCSLTCYLLLATRYLLLATCYSLLATRYLQVDKDLCSEVVNINELLDCCDVAEADELADRLKAAAAKLGSIIKLDAKSLSDPGKQEELVQLFGEDWEVALGACLEEPLVPARDDDSEAEEEGARPTKETMLTYAEELALDVKRELLDESTDLMQQETDNADGSAELMLLATLTPKQLVTKLLARNCRRRQRQAEASEAMVVAQRELTPV